MPRGRVQAEGGGAGKLNRYLTARRELPEVQDVDMIADLRPTELADPKTGVREPSRWVRWKEEFGTLHLSEWNGFVVEVAALASSLGWSAVRDLYTLSLQEWEAEYLVENIPHVTAELFGAGLGGNIKD